MPRLPCRNPKAQQISTGQAGADVNRDLETLFALANNLSDCVAKIANFLNANGGGGFDTGGTGSGGTGDGGGTGGTITTEGPGKVGGTGVTLESANPATDRTQYIRTAYDFTLPIGARGVWQFDLTANIIVTLPPPAGCMDPTIVNATAATYSITLKDDRGNTVATLAPTEAAMITPRDASTGAYWPSVVTTV